MQTRSLIGIEVVASIQVRADGVVVFEALTDDSRFTVIAFLKTTCKERQTQRKTDTRLHETIWKCHVLIILAKNNGDSGYYLVMIKISFTTLKWHPTLHFVKKHLFFFTSLLVGKKQTILSDIIYHRVIRIKG